MLTSAIVSDMLMIKTARSLFTETVIDISCGTLFPTLFKWGYSEPGDNCTCTVEEEGWKH